MNIIKKLYNHILWRTNFDLNITIPQLFLSYFLPKKVATGPFAGMKYLSKSIGSVILPKLVGTYEDELHSVFEKIKNENYVCFIDIGAAEGYYAVGVKKFLLTNTEKVIAFEATETGRKLIKELAHANEVSGLQIRGFCDLAALSSVIDTEKIFIICDIEGGEYELLNPKIIDFSRCDLLVETHHFGSKQKEDELIKSFSNSHHIVKIAQGEKKLPGHIEWKHMIRKYQNFVVNEFRGDTSWLFMTKKG